MDGVVPGSPTEMLAWPFESQAARRNRLTKVEIEVGDTLLENLKNLGLSLTYDVACKRFSLKQCWYDIDSSPKLSLSFGVTLSLYCLLVLLLKNISRFCCTAEACIITM